MSMPNTCVGGKEEPSLSLNYRTHALCDTENNSARYRKQQRTISYSRNARIAQHEWDSSLIPFCP